MARDQPDLELQEQLQSCQIEKQAISQQLVKMEAELVRAQETIRIMQKQEQASRKEIEELKWQLLSSEGLVADLQKEIQWRESQLQEIKKASELIPNPRTWPSPYLTQESTAPPVPEAATVRPGTSPSSSVTGGPSIRAPMPPSSSSTSEKLLTVQCYIQKPAEQRWISKGSATIDGNFAYFMPHNRKTVHRYNVINGQWIDLPEPPYFNMSLVIINGTVVAVGGSVVDNDTSLSKKLFTLRNNKWIEDYPPMDIARSCCAAVSIVCGLQNHVIVIGGNSDDGHTSSVEFLNTASRCWYQFTHLPQPLILPSAAVCGNTLHVVSSTGDGYSCSLQRLLSCDESQPPPCTLMWISLPHLPVTDTAIATLRGQVVLVGGVQDYAPVDSIHQLVGGQWVVIGSLLIARQQCLVVSPSSEKLIVVGGIATWLCVELCNAE